MRLFHKKNVVDERELMEMFQVEHYVCWITFWALLISIFYQLFFVDDSFSQVGGEWCVFMVMAFGILIGNLKGGHFDYSSRPGWKYYLFYSVIAAVAVGVITLIRGMMIGYYKDWKMAASAVGRMGTNTFLITFVLLALFGTYVKYRRKKLEDVYNEDDED